MANQKEEDEFAETMKNYFILDSGGTMSMFCNPDLLENIRASKNLLRVLTNGGNRDINTEGDLGGYGTVWFNENLLGNIFGFADMAKRYRITCDTAIENAIIVHTENGPIKFEKSPEGLYHYKIPEHLLKKKPKTQGTSNLVEMVAENRQGYTKRQYEKAKTARAMYHNVGPATVENFKHMIRSNMVKNCPVTVEDVTIAEKIFGPAMSSLKGKSTRQKPPLGCQHIATGFNPWYGRSRAESRSS